MAQDETNGQGEVIDDPNDPALQNQQPDESGGALSRMPAKASKPVVGSTDYQRNRVDNLQAGQDETARGMRDAQAGLSNAYAAQLNTLKSAQQRLLGMNVGPTEQEKAYQMASIGGDSAGRYDPGAHNAMLASQLKDTREAEMQKNALIAQYGMQVPQAQIGQATAQYNQLLASYRIGNGALNSAEKDADKYTNQAPKAIPGGMVFSASKQNPDGTMGGYEYHPEIVEHQNQQKADQMRSTLAIKAASAQAMAGKMDPTTLDLLSETFLRDGKMPAMGQGVNGTAARLAIAKRAGEKALERNDNMGEAIAGQVWQQAQKTNMVNLQKQYGAFKGFENTMVNVGQNAQQLSDKVPRTGSNLANKVFQWTDRTLSSPADLSNFDLVNNTLASEYGKIMSGSMGNTPVAEGIAKAAHEKLMVSMSNGTYHSVVNQMIQEGILRNKGLMDNITDSGKELASGTTPWQRAKAAAATSPPGATPHPNQTTPPTALHPLVSLWLNHPAK